jgi:Glycogen recognition site of AMP-activated protein kinase/Domain of unknown function (DUF3471)
MMMTQAVRTLVVALALHLAAAGAQAQAKAEGKRAEALKGYAGRYELEVGLIPVSTLDVTLAGGELWLKPSNVKRRRLARGRRDSFTDEVAGTAVRFGRDDEGRVVSLSFVYEGEPYTARRVELPAPSVKGNTTFKLKGHPDASLVVLTGSFNNWHQSQLLFAREGDEWVCRVDLDPGVYQYKFVVDGDWLLDPSNPDTAEDEAGNVNNVIEVKRQ